MGLRVSGRAPAQVEETEPDSDEESEEQFTERIYLALMRGARRSSERLRTQLGSCVLLGTAYADAPEAVQIAIRQFIDDAAI